MKTIKLKVNSLGRYDDVSPFIVTDNQLQLKVELPFLNGEFYLVTENNGVKEKRLLPRDGSITLENLTAGELNAVVKHYLKGELIREYKIEPLLLKEVNDILSAIPEIEELNRHISSIERSFKELNTGFEELKLRQERAEANQLAIIKFAYEDFKDNVYLGGGSFEEFASKFGLNLTADEINSIKGEKKND